MASSERETTGPRLEQLWVGAAVLLPTFYVVPAIAIAVAVQAGIAGDPANWTAQQLIERGVLAKWTHEQVIRFAPPLVITKEDLEWALGHIREVFTA